MNDKIIRHIEQNWNEHFKNLLDEKPKGLHYVQISQSHTKDFDKGRIVLLIFAAGKRNPILIAKYTRDVGYEANLEEEVKNTEAINDSVPGLLFPKNYASIRIDNKLVIFEEFVPGISLNAYIREQIIKESRDPKEITEEIFEIVEGILEKLNSKREEVKDKAEIQKELLSFLNRYEDELKLNDSVKSAIKESIKFVSESKIPVYKGIINFDFIPGNIIQSGETHRIIDLEFSTRSKLSFIEPIRFIFYYLELLTDLGVLETKDFPSNLGLLSFKKKHWLYKAIKMHFSKYIEAHLLSDYFLVMILYNKQMQSFVAYKNKYKSQFFNDIYMALTDYVNYLTKTVKTKENDILYVQTALKDREEYIKSMEMRSSLSQSEVSDLREQLAAVSGSRAWRILTKLRTVKDKILRRK